MSSIINNSDVNVGILIERIRILENLLFNSYKVPGGTEISFDFRTLLGINAMDVYLILFWFANNYVIKIEDNKFIINYDPLNIKMVDNYNYLKNVMFGGTDKKAIIKYKKNQLIRVSQMVGWKLLWLFMWIMNFFITLQTFRYFFFDSMRTLSEINVSTFNVVQQEITDPHGLKDPIIKKVSDLMEKYYESGIDSNGEEENNYQLVKINLMDSFSGKFKEQIEQLQLPSPYNNVEFDNNVTNDLFPMYDLYYRIFFSALQAGDPSELGDLFNPLQRHVKPRMEELKGLFKEKQQKMYNLKRHIEDWLAVVRDDLENTERVISSSTPILTAAADYTTDFLKFMRGATKKSRAGQHQQKLYILMELLRLLPRVSNHITTAIPNTIGDIYSIYNNLQTLSNMCMAMYVISGIITYIIQTVFYYIIVAILKVGGGDKDTKLRMIDINYIFAQILDEASNGELSPEIITFIIAKAQLKDINPDIAITVAPEFKHFINNDHNIQTALNELCKYLADLDNVINLKNLYIPQTGLGRRVNAVVGTIKDNSLLSKAIKNKKVPLLIKESGGRRIRKYNRSKKPRKKQKSKKTRRKMRKSKNKSKK